MAQRHAYFPILRHVTENKSLNGLICFTLSAVLHEIVIALPLHTYRMPLAFVGMMAQVPRAPGRRGRREGSNGPKRPNSLPTPRNGRNG